MTLWWPALARLRLVFIAIFITSVVSFFLYSHPDTSRAWGSITAAYHQSVSLETKVVETPPNLPAEYDDHSRWLSSYCADRYTHVYLENLRDSATQYCSPESISSVTCFHSKTTKSRTDSLCLGRSVNFDSLQKKFILDCKLRELDEDGQDHGIPKLTSLAGYWYETGPGVILDDFVHLESTTNEVVPTTQRVNYTILIKREGHLNPWHCLLEIFSMAMTLDVLRMTIDDSTGAPFLSQEDFDNMQVVILDSRDNGPYFDLWQLFAKRPTLRVNDLAAVDGTNNDTIDNIIIPLAGASNPVWQGDWSTNPCQGSDLLEVFSRRTIDFYNVTAPPQRENIVVTYIDRKESRRLINHEAYLEELRRLYPNNVKVQSVDFASLSFEEQIQVDQETDILVGVHGAGLTHALFLPPQSVVVEILPSSLNYKVFRNFAGLLGHSYYSAHATEKEPEKEKRDDWHHVDVEISQDRFLQLMDLAIKGLYNKGLRDSDAV